jgi:signal transduction histidine kinase
MTRVPIRIRLTIAFAAATAVVLAAAAAFVYVRVGNDLNRALDVQLRGRAQDVAALVRRDGSLRATTGDLVEPGESFAELVAPGGRVLDATAPIGRTLLLSQAELARARRGPVVVDRPSVPGLDEPARLLATPVGRRVLVVGATRENRAEILSSMRTAFLVGGPVALLVAALAGYALAGAALRPIEAMRRRAAAISTSSLGERLPVPPADDEVARLGTTLNAMLARIEDGVARERQFVIDASHELRTPLALLTTELDLALARARTREELEGALRSAAESADRLARLANDLLVLARTDLPLDTQPTDVTDVLGAVAARFRPRAETEGRSLAVEGDDPLVLSVDRLRLEQALTNMVDNALRHGRGRITLTAATRNGVAELHVRDEGPGFPAAFLDRAFERFSRADEARSGDGSGLGLAIADTIARGHGGRAHAANLPGGGADIWLVLPLASET